MRYGLALCALALWPAAALGQDALSWEDCLREALANNPERAAAEALVQQSRFDYRASASRFLPQLSFDASYRRGGSRLLLDDASVNSEDFSVGLTLSQSLFAGFRHQAERDRNRWQVEANEAARRAVRAQVGFDLKTAFARLLFAQDRVTLAEAIAARRKENLELVELRFEAGREHKGSFARSQAAHHDAEFDVAQAQRALRVAQRELAAALGRRDPGALGVAGDFEVAPPPPAPAFEALAENTPARLQQTAQARAAAAGVTLARAPFFPELSASGAVSRSGDEPNVDFDSEQWSAGVFLTFPLFTGGRNTYGFQAAQAAFRRAQADLQSATNDVLIALQQAHAAFQDSVERVEVRREFVTASELRAEIARKLYSTGLMTFENWDLIENDLITARSQMLASLRDRLTAEAAWERAQGQGLTR